MPTTKPPPSICAVQDCDQRVRLNVELNGKRTGMCNTHARRTQRHGSPFISHKRPGGPCEVEGCGEQARRWGYCPSHSEQYRTHGDPLTRVRASPGSGTTRKDGYRQVSAPAHPLADAYGHVLEHRAVLHDTIGPGGHRCHWCRAPVNWTASDTEELLITDHLDFDRANNDPANLVPSCNACNVRRSQLTPEERTARGRVAAAARRHSQPSQVL
jgi:hypothetical protein